MEFFLLGRVSATVAGQSVALGSFKQRFVLAALLLEANRPVETDRLIGLCWSDDPPPSARATLQTLVWRLRQALSPDGDVRLDTTRTGYALRVPAEHIDAVRFYHLVRDARAAADDRRERLVALEVVALYRSGQTVEALNVHRRATRVLAEDFGLDPGPLLRGLDLDILRGLTDRWPGPALA